MIVYLYGFNSGGTSAKAAWLRQRPLPARSAGGSSSTRLAARRGLGMQGKMGDGSVAGIARARASGRPG